MKTRSAILALLLWAGAVGATGMPAFDQGRQLRATDSKRAFVLIEDAAKAGHAPAMFILSSMLMAGEGTTRDEQRGRQWLEQAASEEYPEAMQQLALFLQDSAGGYARDEQRAAQLMRKMGHALKHREHGH